MEDENIDTTKEIVTIKKEGFSYPEMVIIMIIAILFGFLIGNVVSFTKKETTNSSVPSELKERYNNVLTLNYVNNCCKQGKIEGNIFDIYNKNKESFLRDMGLINTVNGNGGEYMQNKIIKEENNNEEYL